MLSNKFRIMCLALAMTLFSLNTNCVNAGANTNCGGCKQTETPKNDATTKDDTKKEDSAVEKKAKPEQKKLAAKKAVKGKEVKDSKEVCAKDAPCCKNKEGKDCEKGAAPTTSTEQPKADTAAPVKAEVTK